MPRKFWSAFARQPVAIIGKMEGLYHRRSERTTMNEFIDSAPPAERPLPSDCSIRAEEILEEATISVRHINDIGSFSTLRESWKKIELKFRTPLLSHNWLYSCARSFCPPSVFKIILIRSGEEIRAIAPLTLRGKPRRRIEILGSSITDEPGGLLFTDEDSLTELLNSVLDQNRTIFFKGLRFGSPESRILEKLVRERGLRSLVREERLPWVPTIGRWEEFEKTISSSRRSSLRRLQRLAESKGKLEFEVLTPSPDQVEVNLTELFGVEAASWKGRTGTAMQSMERLGRFFMNYSRLEAQDGNLRLFFLRVDGRAIAAQLTAVDSNRLWIFKIGHDESWSWCSPGILLMHRVIKYCFETGLDACELLGSDEPWLHIWTDETHSVVTYRIYPGLFDAVYDVTADFWKLTLYKIQRRTAKRRTGEKKSAE